MPEEEQHTPWSATSTSTDYELSTTKLVIDPATLETLATVGLKNTAEHFAGRIKAVGDIWDGLALSWNGKTQAEADDFNNRWRGSMHTLFGTADDEDDPGLLGQVINVVYLAAGNFANAESSIADAFQKMADGLGGDSGGSSSAQDSTLPPIQIDY